MIRLYVNDAKKEQFRIEATDKITIITGLTAEGRPIYIFEGIRDDVNMENAEEMGYALKYNPMEPHRFPADTNLVVNPDKRDTIKIVAEEHKPDPEIVTPNIPQTINEAITGEVVLPPVKVNLTPSPDVRPAEHIDAPSDDDTDTEEIPVVGDITPDGVKSLSDGNLPLPEDVPVPPPPAQEIPQRQPAPPPPPKPVSQPIAPPISAQASPPPQLNVQAPARQRPVPPTRRPGGRRP